MPRTSILADKAKFQEAVDECNSIRDLLHYLGLRSAGGNYRQAHLYSQKHGILLPRDTISQTAAARSFNTIPLEDILVRNSVYTNRLTLKKRCYAAGLLREECYECSQGPIWNGRSLTLQLEHLNGIWNDNRIENLAILCPNCHSQTDTFCGRSSSIRKCVCGANVSRKASECIGCSNKKKNQPSKINWPSIEELKERLLQSNYSQLARELGVSDNAIRKHLNL